jgi:putative membrane protein
MIKIKIAMKRLGSVIMIALAAWLLQACSNSTKNRSDAIADTTTTVSVNTPKTAGPVEIGDAQFAFEAADGSMAEIELGKLAIQKGENKRVKNFGAMMVKDHTKANDKLIALAKTKNITLPSAPDANEQKVINMLSKKSGKDFDEAYISDMIDNHQKDIKEFQFASKNCSDPDIKAFARKTLPVLKNHLDAINTVYESMK